MQGRLRGKRRRNWRLVLFPGDYQFHNPQGYVEALVYCCPGCGALLSLLFNAWKWNGDFNKPTITPNMRHEDCGWLGRLTNGFWVTLVDEIVGESPESLQ
jgi:hypothetical protein